MKEPIWLPDDEESKEVWNDLELPPRAPTPTGFSQQVVEHCRERASAEAASSNWLRVAAVAALLVGWSVGLRFGDRPSAEMANVRPASIETVELLGPWQTPASVPSLDDRYWAGVATLEDTP